MIIKDANGKEVEVFTAEELKAKTDAAVATAREEASKTAVEEYQKQHPDMTKDLNDLKEKLADSEARLETALNDGKGGNEEQIKRLREERETAKTALKDFQDKVLTEVNNFKASFAKETKDEIFDALSKGDKEIRKKIEFFYDSFKGDALTKKEMRDRAEQAYVLATGKKAEPSILDGITGAGARGQFDHQGGGGGNQKPVSDNEKAIGNVLGVTDEMREKYRGKVRSSSAD